MPVRCGARSASARRLRGWRIGRSAATAQRRVGRAGVPIRSPSSPRRCLDPSEAKTAFTDFSTVCWTWKPTTSSACSGSSESVRAAVRSAAAFRRIRRGSWRSGLGKEATLAHGTLDHRAALSCALVRLRLVHHDDVDRHFELVQLAAQPDRLSDHVVDGGLDDENVEVRVGVSVAARVRPEQDDAGVGRRRLREPLADLLDHLGGRHGGKVADWAEHATS